MQRQRLPLRRLARFALVAVTAGTLLVGIPGWSPGGPNSPAGDPAVNAAAASVEPVADPVLVGAGDIASCYLESDAATAALLDGIDGTVFTVGDNAYLDGTAEEFAGCYEPTWGRHRARTRPAAGNHEYHTTDATPYWDYFGDAAGDRGKGWYSYDLGGWHVVVLNSVLSLEAGSEQERWLRADLAAHQTTCTVAYWHHPRFSSGSRHGGSPELQPTWQALYDHDADLVLSGHEHHYERFAPQDPSGHADPKRGIRQFVVGTGGGKGHYPFGRVADNSEKRNGDTFGVLKLTLHPTSYDWEFVPVEGKIFRDSGSRACH